MPQGVLDPYCAGSSLVHGLDARAKLVVALAFILTVNLLPLRAWPLAPVLLGMLVLIAGLARLAPGPLLRRSAIALPFALLAAVALPFIQEGPALAQVRVLGITLTVTTAGLAQFGSVVVRSWLSLLMATLLAMTTPFSEIIQAMRSLGLPRILGATIALMYRYLFVLVDEAQRLLRARAARSAAPKVGHAGGSLRWRAQVTGSLIGTLFIRTYERSERVYQAMLARGFDGELLSLRANALSRRDWVVGGAATILLGAVTLAGALCW